MWVILVFRANNEIAHTIEEVELPFHYQMEPLNLSAYPGMIPERQMTLGRYKPVQDRNIIILLGFRK
jgi:hypothetical protein